MQIKAYHGSNANFNKFEQSNARIVNDFYGGGVAYFTDNMQVAGTYAKNMSKRGGEPIVYEVRLNFSNLFDTDKTFTGKELTKFYDDIEVERFARGARLLTLNSDKYDIISKLKSGDMTLTGDQIFRGLSMGMNQTALARKKLILLGYDGLRHNGGVNMNMATKHNVYLAYKASNINIIKKYGMPKSKPNQQPARATL